MFGSALLEGMVVTAKNLVGSYFDKDRLTTIEYPEERKEPEENYRNFPFLICDKDPAKTPDYLRCVACKICESECPPQCIYIEVKRDENGKPVKQPKVFDIDYSVCMGCQICAEVCPFDAIKMDHEYELSNDNRFTGLLMHKWQLARPNEYYHSIKPTEAAEVDARLAEEAAKKKKPAVAPARPASAPAAKPAAPAAPVTPSSKPVSVVQTSVAGIVVPADAPFTSEQREWLQKFFVGVAVAAPARPASPSSQPSTAAPVAAPALKETPADAENPDLTDKAPWHDSNKDLNQRMKMAGGKPLAVRLYAAMGQTDCTACGYDCKGYAMALASGNEKDPGLCGPGGDETAAKVKELLEAAGIQV
ncbi:MAG: 4Fe-4S binding protein [Verrucomicrobia bacterium]|nr:4Fe-4S binding protein [Verrucomicrobiota bacterium]